MQYRHTFATSLPLGSLDPPKKRRGARGWRDKWIQRAEKRVVKSTVRSRGNTEHRPFEKVPTASGGAARKTSEQLARSFSRYLRAVVGIEFGRNSGLEARRGVLAARNEDNQIFVGWKNAHFGRAIP